MNKAHPFPKHKAQIKRQLAKRKKTAAMHIEAHAGSSVVVGCSGHTNIGASMPITDEMENDLLRFFRSLPIREKVRVLMEIYEFEERRRNETTKVHSAEFGKMA